MKLTVRIPIITALLLLLTLIINIGGIWYSLSVRIPTYLAEKGSISLDPSLSPENLRTIFSLEDLDASTKREYQSAIDQLSSISSSLESLSRNPELYLSSTDAENENGTGSDFHAGANAFAIHIGSGQQMTLTLGQDGDKTDALRQFMNIFLYPSGIERNSAEWLFFVGVMEDFFILNACWFLIVIIFYTFWIRRLFSPIHMINTHIQEFLGTPQFHSLVYHKNDEFAPLITTLNNLHDSLVKQEDIRTQFLADISHELRTPMTAIKCLLEAIDDGVMELDANTIRQLQNEITRLVAITNRILEYESSLIQDSVKIDTTPIAIRDMTHDMINQYLPQLRKNSQIIENLFDEDLTLHLNADQYAQILHNIFSNFIKYSGKNTTLRCNYRKNSHFHELRFEDNGKGVQKSKLPFIKEKFYREDTGRTRTDDYSMGIGLSIIERILSYYGGSLRVAATRPHGLTLLLLFPKHYDAKNP